MPFEVGDDVKVTSDLAPFFSKRGVVEQVDGGYRVLPLVGVRFPGHSVVRWYSELELGPVTVDAPTEEIAAVAP